jgi:hypothetical protein
VQETAITNELRVLAVPLVAEDTPSSSCAGYRRLPGRALMPIKVAVTPGV